ncbi:MAG: hypothetical protein HZC29_02770 [Thaumarchaeota archaeon]|nr:hypothetical protein [Nitrososphaerota archaeon]
MKFKPRVRQSSWQIIEAGLKLLAPKKLVINVLATQPRGSGTGILQMHVVPSQIAFGLSLLQSSLQSSRLELKVRLDLAVPFAAPETATVKPLFAQLDVQVQEVGSHTELGSIDLQSSLQTIVN